MRMYFDVNGVMHICPENMTEGMALKYWIKEYQAHGAKMIDVETEPSTELPERKPEV